MEALAVIGYIAGLFGLIAVISSAVIIVRSTTSKTTIEQQKELIEVLQAAKAEKGSTLLLHQGMRIYRTK